VGRKKRHVPEFLPYKLWAIRTVLGISQEEMAEKLTHKKVPVYQGHVSAYENGLREPPLVILLQYARVGGLPVDALLDDEWDLPDRYHNFPYSGEET
jgi:transcriptional regulator with XRE-family HTH domain